MFKLILKKMPVKTKIMKKTDKELIFNKYDGKCAYCGCDLQKDCHVGHIEPIVRDFIYNKNKHLYYDNEENPRFKGNHKHVNH